MFRIPAEQTECDLHKEKTLNGVDEESVLEVFQLRVLDQILCR